MDIQVDLSPWRLVFGAFLCLILPLPWVTAALTAALIHEAVHMLAVLLSGGVIQTLRIGAWGAEMNTSYLSASQQLFCILAGPASSLLLTLTGKYTPRLALCGFVQGLYNALPVFPLDGGRALRCAAGSVFLPDTAECICNWTEKVAIFIIIGGGFWASVIQQLGAAPLILSVLVVSRSDVWKKILQRRGSRSTIGLPYIMR